MDYFPAFLDLNDRACLVVGGGNVALRKIRLLRAAGARISVVAPETIAAIDEMADRGELVVRRRAFLSGDVRGAWLVVSATGDLDVERNVFAAASDAGVFCNSVDSIDRCSYITPAIVDRSPLVVAISSGGKAPVLARQLREKLEGMLPARLARLAALAGRWRERVGKRITNSLGRRRFWEQVLTGPAADDVLAGREDRAEQRMADALNQNTRETEGVAWLVGAGPGDPGLLTLRALQLMQAADVILHDRLVSDDVLALARRDADLISVGKSPTGNSVRQEDINALLVQLVREGKRVCRLKGGDPFIFGRGGEEAEVLDDAGCRYEVVPGVTAAAACAAYSGIPLTHRKAAQCVVLLTAHGQDNVDNLDWPSLARDRQTLAVYMGVRRFPELMNGLIAHGRATDTPIAIVERGTMAEQRVIRGTLGQLTLLAEAYRVESPSILIIGEVAASTLSQYSHFSARDSSIESTTRLTR